MINVTPTKTEEELPLELIPSAPTSKWVVKDLPLSKSEEVCPDCHEPDCPVYELEQHNFECDRCGNTVYRDREREIDLCYDCESDLHSEIMRDKFVDEGKLNRQDTLTKQFTEFLAKEGIEWPKASEIKVFQINDSEWWAGTDIESIAKVYEEQTGIPPSEAFDAFMCQEVSPEAMNRLIVTSDDGDYDIDGEPARETFQHALDHLINYDYDFPCFFAGTEYL